MGSKLFSMSSTEGLEHFEPYELYYIIHVCQIPASSSFYPLASWKSLLNTSDRLKKLSFC